MLISAAGSGSQVKVMVTLIMMIWPGTKPVRAVGSVVEVKAPNKANSPEGVSKVAPAHDCDGRSALRP